MPFSDTPLPTTKPWAPNSRSTNTQNGLPHDEQIQARTELIDRCRSAYGASKTCKAVRGMIRKALSDTSVVCDAAVLVGLGELDAAVNNGMRGPWQLALFLNSVEFMEKELESRQAVDADDISGEAENTKFHKNGNEDTTEDTEMSNRQGEDRKEAKQGTIKLYAQDPQFGKLEKDILTSYGFTIVETPEIRHHITPTTFLFAPFVEWTVLIPQIIGARDPFLYIGSDMDVIIEVLTLMNPL
jgi:hypothetical protein